MSFNMIYFYFKFSKLYRKKTVCGLLCSFFLINFLKNNKIFLKMSFENIRWSLWLYKAIFTLCVKVCVNTTGFLSPNRTKVYSALLLCECSCTHCTAHTNHYSIASPLGSIQLETRHQSLMHSIYTV